MLVDVIIRPFGKNDAEDISRLIIDNLMLVNVVDYGEKAVEQMARFYSPDWILRYARSSAMYVAEVNSKIVGTATLDKNRVRNVNVRIDVQRQGVGKLLMRYIEELAVQQGKQRLELLANVAAVDFYRDLGYLRCEDKKIEVGDTQITVVFMEKDLVTRESFE